MSTEPFVIERTLNATTNKLWDAITDNVKMKQWYFDLKEFKPQVGFEFRFTGGSEEKQYLHICTITDVVLRKKLTHSWMYDGYEGKSFVTWELFEEGDKTRIKLTHTGLETFPNLPDFARSSFEAGWTYIVGTSLPEYLAKG